MNGPRALWVSPQRPTAPHCDALTPLGLQVVHLEADPAAAAWIGLLAHQVLLVHTPGGAAAGELGLLAAWRRATAAPMLLLGRPACERLQSRIYDLGVDEQLDAAAGAPLLAACLRLKLQRGPTAGLGLAQLQMDGAGRQGFWCRQPLDLTPFEARLLHTLAQAPQLAASRDTLARCIPLQANWRQARSLDVLVSRLRRALRAQTQGALAIDALTGWGYRLRLQAGTPATGTAARLRANPFAAERAPCPTPSSSPSTATSSVNCCPPWPTATA